MRIFNSRTEDPPDYVWGEIVEVKPGVHDTLVSWLGGQRLLMGMETHFLDMAGFGLFFAKATTVLRSPFIWVEKAP